MRKCASINIMLHTHHLNRNAKKTIEATNPNSSNVRAPVRNVCVDALAKKLPSAFPATRIHKIHKPVVTQFIRGKRTRHPTRVERNASL